MAIGSKARVNIVDENSCARLHSSVDCASGLCNDIMYISVHVLREYQVAGRLNQIRIACGLNEHSDRANRTNKTVIEIYKQQLPFEMNELVGGRARCVTSVLFGGTLNSGISI